MDRRYKHLNGEERGVIFAEHRHGASLRSISALSGMHASTSDGSCDADGQTQTRSSCIVHNFRPLGIDPATSAAGDAACWWMGTGCAPFILRAGDICSRDCDLRSVSQPNIITSC